MKEAVLLSDEYAKLKLGSVNKNTKFLNRQDNTYMQVQVPCSCGSTTTYMFRLSNADLGNEELTVEDLADLVVRMS